MRSCCIEFGCDLALIEMWFLTASIGFVRPPVESEAFTTSFWSLKRTLFGDLFVAVALLIVVIVMLLFLSFLSGVVSVVACC